MSRLAVLLTASLLLACGSQNPAPAAEPPAEKPADAADPADAPPEEGFADPNAKPGGEIPTDCDYQVKDKCFMDKDAACKEAGCEPDKCIVAESLPAQVGCG